MSVLILKKLMLICACARFGKANVLNAVTNSCVIFRTLAVQIAYKFILGGQSGPVLFQSVKLQKGKRLSGLVATSPS